MHSIVHISNAAISDRMIELNDSIPEIRLIRNV